MSMTLSLESPAYRGREIRGRLSYGANRDRCGVERLRGQLIEEAAYYRWIRRGGPFGAPWTDWFAAEAEIVYGRSVHSYPADRTTDERPRHRLIENPHMFAGLIGGSRSGIRGRTGSPPKPK
jgi:Protein of unknown function (DUF2934)